MDCDSLKEEMLARKQNGFNENTSTVCDLISPGLGRERV